MARFGGDEVVVLLEDLDGAAEAEAVAARVLDRSCGCELPPGLDTRVSASIGLAVTDDGAISVDALVLHADAAMYRAKRFGGNAYAAAEVPACPVDPLAVGRVNSGGGHAAD